MKSFMFLIITLTALSQHADAREALQRPKNQKSLGHNLRFTVSPTLCGASPGKAPKTDVKAKKSVQQVLKETVDETKKKVLRMLFNLNGVRSGAEKEGTDACVSLQGCSTIGKTGSTEEVLTKLRTQAENVKPNFDNMVRALTLKVQPSTCTGTPTTCAEFKDAPLKGEPRCKEKIVQKYSVDGKYGVRELTDIVRGSIFFKKGQDICDAFAKINSWTGAESKITIPDFDGTAIEFVGLKNRFKVPAGGYSDILANIRITGNQGTHVTELQFHHADMRDTKSSLHPAYDFTRKVAEIVKLNEESWEKVEADRTKAFEPLVKSMTEHPNNAIWNSLETKWKAPRDPKAIPTTLKVQEVYDLLSKAMEAGFLAVSTKIVKDAPCLVDLKVPIVAYKEDTTCK
jgi:hypothetical protein